MIIEARPTRWIVGHCELHTVVELDDEGAGWFVKVDQPGKEAGDELRFDREEWPAIRDAIDRAFAEIKRHEEAEKAGGN